MNKIPKHRTTSHTFIITCNDKYHNPVFIDVIRIKNRTLNNALEYVNVPDNMLKRIAETHVKEV